MVIAKVVCLNLQYMQDQDLKILKDERLNITKKQNFE